MNPTTRRLLAVLAAGSLAFTACSSDDGGTVRNIGADDGSGSASGSASGPGSGSASGPASGPSSEVLGGYVPVSDVDAHSRISEDSCDVTEALDADPIDFEAAAAVYRDGGNSTNSDGSVRTMSGFATTERDEAVWNSYVEYFDDPTWLDSFMTAALEGTGVFSGEADAVRRQAVQKSAGNQIAVAWVIHELVAALEKAEAGDLDPAGGAPHNWDEAWAFYHGTQPGCAPFGTAASRGENFGTGDAVTDALLEVMQEGQQALVDGDVDAAAAARDEALRILTIPYVQATIRYATIMQSDLEAGDDEAARTHQAEGWAFWRVIAPLVANADADAAAEIEAVLDLANEPSASADTVLAAIESTYGALGITAEEVGTLQES